MNTIDALIIEKHHVLLFLSITYFDRGGKHHDTRSEFTTRAILEGLNPSQYTLCATRCSLRDANGEGARRTLILFRNDRALPCSLQQAIKRDPLDPLVGIQSALCFRLINVASTGIIMHEILISTNLLACEFERIASRCRFLLSLEFS